MGRFPMISMPTFTTLAERTVLSVLSVIILLILITFSLYNVLMLLGENLCWYLLGFERLIAILPLF